MTLRFRRSPPDDIETLHPAYFALVMATGIVALATHIHRVPVAPTALFWLNVVFLAGLIAATITRLVRYPHAFLADLRSHSRGVGFFTIVAAVAVFGDELVLQMDTPRAAIICWFVAAAFWPVILYGILATLIVKPRKPDLAHGINGGWLTSVVATQSLPILTINLLPFGIIPADLERPLMFFSLILWLGGGILYLWLITLIFYRYAFLPMVPEDFNPPYWINMGAVAISTLAGAALLTHGHLSPVVMEVTPFIKGFTLTFWAVGSFWIPMLVILGVWRFLIRSVPVAYDPLYWTGVFPLGMYSVCTYRLTQILDAPFLVGLSRVFMVIAAIAWLATFMGLMDSLLHTRTRLQPSD